MIQSVRRSLEPELTVNNISHITLRHERYSEVIVSASDLTRKYSWRAETDVERDEEHRGSDIGTQPPLLTSTGPVR